MKINITKKDLFLFLLSFTLLCIFLYIFYPGILTYDSYNQLHQIEVGQFTTWHPFFHTFIEMMLLKIKNTPAIIAFFQIIVFSGIWTYICHYSRTKTTRNFIFQAAFTILICLNPINFLYSITLWKDILFSYYLLLVCFLLQIIVDKNFQITWSLAFVFSVTLSFLAQIRYNGIYIVIVLLLVLAILFFRKDRNSKMFLKVPLITMATILAISSLNVIYKVEDNEKNAIAPKIMQYLSFYLKDNKITKQDQKTIAKVASIEKLKKEYQASYTDSTYLLINMKQYEKEKQALFKLCLKYTIKNPLSAVTFVFDSTSFVWNPLFPKDRVGLIITTDITSENNSRNLTPRNLSKESYQQANKIVNNTLKIEWLKVILYSPAFYFYLSIVVMLILWFKKRYRTVLIVLPNLLNIIIVAISNPVHDVRYLYPNLLVFYFLCIILLKKLEENNERKTVKIN